MDICTKEGVTADIFRFGKTGCTFSDHKKFGLQIQNLYILSDEKLKEGDLKDNTINQFWKPSLASLNNQCQKIIASTDPSLSLPRIPEEFLSKYIEKYNQGNPIKEVEVEYEEYHGFNHTIAEVYAVRPFGNKNALVISL